MQQGKRNDLLEIKQLLDEGKTSSDIAESHFSKWVVYRRSFQAYAARKIPKRNWKTLVHVYWGRTGTGKTRFVHDQVQDERFWSPGDFKWFDGYDGQPIVIIDDYRGEYELPLFLKLCDRYPMQVPIKGGFVNWAPRKIYITSNTSPDTWYSNADNWSFQAFRRRLTLVSQINSDIY
jgi:hypothetical protein